MNVSSTSHLAVYFDGNAARRIEPRGIPARETPAITAISRESRRSTTPVEQVIEGEVINQPRESARAYDEISGREFLQRRRINDQLHSEYDTAGVGSLRLYQETSQVGAGAARQVDVYV